jgi:conjugative relaxase-like TrwC/TraI family protein
VLTIAKLGVGQESYYLSKVAKGIEDYYSGEGETPGAWMGRGAARLGLGSEVASAELRALLGGLDPTTGLRLVGRDGAKRVPGWDLTFSAPKSVSVLYGLGGRGVAKEVAAAHDAAVAAGLAYLERHATASRRRVDGKIHQIRGEGLAAAVFQHRTSRAGDPQLHSHALVPNVVESIDGGTGAIHSPVIYRHARTAGFIYQAVLRGVLSERLGVAWDPVHNGHAEIDGIDRGLLEGFSKRRAEIEEAMAQRGEDSARAAQVAAHRTRSAKEYGVDAQTLDDRWHAEARALGFDPGDLATVLDRPAIQVTERQLRDAADDMVSPLGLTAHQATFDHRDVIRAWCEALPVGTKATLDALEDLAEVVESDARVVAVLDGQPAPGEAHTVVTPDGQLTAPTLAERRWTTTEMLDVERRLLAAAAQGGDGPRSRVHPKTVETLLATRQDLTPEQAAMVRRVTTSGEALELVVGRAGAGKTYALAAAAQIWRAAGYRPIGVGLAARAAHELETTGGIPSTTVAQFLIDADHASGLLTPRHVVVVDEASMVDTRRLARLVRHADRADAKVILVGDHHQLPAVEAGGAFAGLIQRLGASELAHNRRQHEAWERHTLDRLRVGADGRRGIEDVVATYGRHDRIHIGLTPADVRAAMVHDWYQARHNGSVAMVALRRSDVDELNCRARALLVADGTVAYHGLDIGDRTFAVGDRVVCLDNDRRLSVHNGLFGHIEHFDTDNRTVTVRPDEGSAVRRLPYSYVAAHLDHAYATTIHKAQGGTYDRTLLLGDDRLYRQAGYSGLSRGRERNDIYLVIDDDREHDPDFERHAALPDDDPVERLIRVLHRDGAKLLANDEANDQPPPVRHSLVELWAERDALVRQPAVDGPPNQHSPTATGHDGIATALARDAQATPNRHVTGDRLSEIDRLQRLDRTLATRIRMAGHGAEIDRPAHIVALIGDPPRDTEGRARWRVAAGAIESYQARWGEELPTADDDQERPMPQATHLEIVRRTLTGLQDQVSMELD